MIYSLYKENIFQKSLNGETVLTESVSDIREYILNIIYKIEDFIDMVCNKLRDEFLYNLSYFKKNTNKIKEGQDILSKVKDTNELEKYKDIIEESFEVVQYSKVSEFISKIIINDSINELIDVQEEIKNFDLKNYINKVSVVENIDVASAVTITYKNNLDHIKQVKRAAKRLLNRSKEICRSADNFDLDKKNKIIESYTTLYKFVRSTYTEIYNHISNEYKFLTKVAIKLIRISDS